MSADANPAPASPENKLHKNEGIKRGSKQLRGNILQTLLDPNATEFSADDQQLIKFHGIYQEDDRDQRVARMKKGEGPAIIMMARTKCPGGHLTGEQYLELDKFSDEFGNGTLRITSRQGIQFHGVLKTGLQELIRRINQINITTLGACGDVERNVMAAPAPLATPAHKEIQRFAREFSTALLPTTRGYMEIWVDGKKVPIDPEIVPDPIYGETYLPRKFKTAIALPPSNDVDVFSNDLGFIAHTDAKGNLEGYTVVVGGGLGMDHGKQETFPALALPLFYVKKEHALAAGIGVVKAQRDHGNRENRKLARLKYVIQKHGVAWFRKQAEIHMPGIPTEDPKPFTFTTLSDPLGFHPQGDGKFFYGVRVENGRVKDHEKLKYRSGIRAIVEKFKPVIRLTANHNIFFCNLKESDKAEVERLLRENGIPFADTYTHARTFSMACVALPTCHLALSESERVFPSVMDGVDAVLRELKLEKESILFRMTGCPNGCVRPYNADFAFVGRGIGKYAMYVGGSHVGDRLGGLVHKSVNQADIPAKVRGYLEDFVKNRKGAETFSDYWGRTQKPGPAPHPSQFHVELAERAKKAGGHAEVTG